MKREQFLVGLMIGMVACLSQLPTAAHAAKQDTAPSVPLFDNLGTLHHPITTKEPRAQAYFDQGLRLVYAFNHEEAIRSFDEAARLDPDAAMAYWGIAYALGPNINATMDRDAERRAYQAIQQAEARAKTKTPKERAYIRALAVRYSSDAGSDRKALDRAYADAMRKVMQEYPADVDAATLFAEALMTVHPWDYWTDDGRAKPGTQETVDVLEHVLKKNPDHMGACHYYIHAVEAWQPQRALACAQRLPDLAPGAGHLVHMPSHIYIRLGMYDKATERNAHAVSVDHHYLEGRDPKGVYPVAYYPHNIHFLWAALTMQGRSQEAMKAARDLMAAVSVETIRHVPEMEFLVPTPLFAMARFGDWEGILREPAPPSDLAYSQALWHYARGLAFTAKGAWAQAEDEHRRLSRIAEALSAERIVGLNSARTLLQIASEVLTGELAVARGQLDAGIQHLEEAVRLQDSLRYYEPPDWYYPVRESLGRALLLVGRPTEAAAVFREDLKRTPANPWSLQGLAQSLQAQRAEQAAVKTEEQFRKAWAQADLPFEPTQFEAFLSSRGG
jgi:tetratricopeptide (TPR) repeat protein